MDLAQRQQPIGSGFGPKSKPDDVLAGIDLAGRVAVVTGGYSGIGLETTRALAGAGATVFVPVRTPAKAAEELADVEGDVRTATMDLGDLASVRAFAADVDGAVDRLDLLVNNAGIMACPEARVGPGWESQLGVNHIGHAALTLDLLPALRRADAPRVVALSSSAHKRSGIRWDDPQFDAEPYDKWAAYGQAKTANALFALALHRRLADDGGSAFSVHPGGILTPLQRHLPIEEQIALGWRGEDGEINPAVAELFKTVTQGCTTTLWAATTDRLGDRGGVFCEDADVAALVGPDIPQWLGVAPHACDPDAAERLWTMTDAWLTDA
jgi:NAD(P)-dependent dehydrogenase (short-subunit alcohol dehydrogenase family)